MLVQLKFDKFTKFFYGKKVILDKHNIQAYINDFEKELNLTEISSLSYKIYLESLDYLNSYKNLFSNGYHLELSYNKDSDYWYSNDSFVEYINVGVYSRSNSFYICYPELNKFLNKKKSFNLYDIIWMI